MYALTVYFCYYITVLGYGRNMKATHCVSDGGWAPDNDDADADADADVMVNKGTATPHRLKRL